VLQLAPEAAAKLLAYSWPGNVRELENVIQRAIVLSNDGVIAANQLVFDEPADHGLYTEESGRLESNIHALDFHGGQRERWRDSQVAPANPFGVHTGPQDGYDDSFPDTAEANSGLQGAMDANEFRIIVDTIKNTRSRQEAADMLGISQRTLRYKIARMRERGIQIPKRRSA
jgi:two-component system response regulator FlrC